MDFDRLGSLPPPPTAENPAPRTVLTVSALTGQIKRILEQKVGQVWVKGEVSNCRLHTNGHIYFSLKDANAQIRAICFKNRYRALKFELKDGMEVVVFGSISIYEATSVYQIIADFMEPAGLGALQAAFEQLKEKLFQEGLFRPERKRPLPFLARRIGIVTSPTGAAIRDMLQIFGRRHPRLSILIAPVRVQGKSAAGEIAQAIRDFNLYHQQKMGTPEAIDLLIVGRGGGSLEDLWCFNEEIVARAIFESMLPVISAVGHEIDFTISDFVADLRAPTPSAAAELATPVYAEIVGLLQTRRDTLTRSALKLLRDKRQGWQTLAKRLVRPDRRLADLRLRLADWTERLVAAETRRLTLEHQRLVRLENILRRVSPLQTLRVLGERRGRLNSALARAIGAVALEKRRDLTLQVEALNARNPLQILSRGYSVARLPDGTVLRSADQIKRGQEFELTLAHGQLKAVTTQTNPEKVGLPAPERGAAVKKSAKSAARAGQGRLF